jgi:short subunit dehydrogenase
VLVTGGAGGIGGAIAAGFAAAGAEVVATAASDAEIAACAPPPGVRLERLDVCDGAAVARLVGGLAGLDVVVNCAGVIRRGEELDPEVFAQVLDVNLAGSMRVCAAARPLLARAGAGAIVKHRLDTLVLRGWARARLRHEQGRGRAADEVASHRLCNRRDQGERDRAGVDPHATDPGGAGRPWPRGGDPRADPARGAGASRGTSPDRRFSSPRRSRASSPGRC